MEAEELMWKSVYNKLQKQKSVSGAEHDLRIQQIDGAFFEKFGSLFRDQVEQETNTEEKTTPNTTDDQFSSTEAVSEEDNENNNKKFDDTVSEISSSEEDNRTIEDELLSFTWNVEELYGEILYEIIHNVGCDVSYEIGQTALFSYIQDAFKISNERHRALLQQAEEKEAPEILINVEIIEAKDLKSKDSNGLSDPFVTLYLSSNAAHRYNTSVKMATLNPVWEEHFALPFSDCVCDDILCLEVWDFDPAESVKEKFGKFLDVKGVKGIRKLVKEIAVTAATGQHENELIGIAKVPLKSMPASGMTMWYSLDKKNKTDRQGVLKLKISFSSKKNSKVAQQEHRNLLKILLLHELESSKVAPYWWSGTYSPHGEALLTQHIAQSGLTPVEIALCQWAVFTSVHQMHHLNYNMFSNILDKLFKNLSDGTIEDVKLFWDGAKQLLPSCFSIIRKIRKKQFKDKMMVKQVVEVLNIINKIDMLTPPPNTILFPANLYPWINAEDFSPNCNTSALLYYAVKKGASDWLNYILENNVKQDGSDVGKLQYLIQIIQMVRSDLQKAVEFYDKHFQGILNFGYSRSLYIFYQEQMSALCETDVKDACKNLKRLSFTGLSLNEAKSNEALQQGTTLFETYLAVQRFVALGQGLCPNDYDTFPIRNFYQWFYGGVAQWLDIAVYKALQRIEKAVELDKLEHVDNTVKYSSSAVDTITIFYQIKVFWQQLNWPDPEGCYTFIAKIIDDLCRCCVFYAEKMSNRVNGMEEPEGIYKKKFEVTIEWCLAINNIEYVRQSLQPFIEEFGMIEVLEKLAELKSPVEAQRCQHTIDNVIGNAIDTVRNEIIELLEVVVSKMVPDMKRLLIEGAELFNQDSNSIDRLMMYVDNNLHTLHNELNEENFDRILDIVWDSLSDVLNEIIDANLEKRRPPNFFANLHKTLNLMVGSFKRTEDSSNCTVLSRTERLLKLNGLETSELIHQTHLDLHERYKVVEESSFGELCVRVKFDQNNLCIEIINARNLYPMDSNGSCDSFVKIHLIPEDKFNGYSPLKTQIHNKTQFPLYDEKFTIPLSDERQAMENALILFSVKDRDMLGYNNQYVGEAYIHFSDIPKTNNNISALPQTHLQLCRPQNLSMESLKALEHRQGDKQAKEFMKRIKQKMGTP